jgi:hypothetical protein
MEENYCDECLESLVRDGEYSTWYTIGGHDVCEGCVEEFEDDLGEKGLVLADFLGVPLSDISVNKYSDSSFEIGGRKVKSGMSIKEARRRADQLKTHYTLRIAASPWSDFLLGLTDRQAYNILKERGDLTEMDDVNALYHILCGDGKDWHVYALRRAWNNQPMEDRRTEYWTNSGEYLVLTDEEAEERARESTETYVDDCVLSEIPQGYRNYFDTEKFVNDVLRHDGIGSVLASYDGSENEHSWSEYGTEEYKIYRTN